MPVALLLTACRSPHPTPTYHPPPALALSITTRFAAPAHALALRGDRLYAGIGDGLRVYDVADPARPVPIGAELPLRHALEALFFDPRRPLAYAALGGLGVAVIDLSDPDLPRVVGTLDTAGDTRWLAVDTIGAVETAERAETTEAVEAGSGTPRRPATGLGSLTALRAGARTRIWLADRKGGLVGLDVTDPTAVTRLGVWPAQDEVRDVVLDGHLAYALDRRHGVHVIDIADAMYPREIGYYDHEGDSDRLFKDGNVVWVKVSSGWWQLDVTDPAAPRLMTATTAIRDTRPPPHVAAALREEVRRGDVVFERERFGVSLASNVAAPLQPIGRGRLIVGNVAIDIRDPLHPAIDPAIEWPLPDMNWSGVHRAIVVDGWRYIADGDGVQTHDVRDPAAPRAGGRVAWAGGGGPGFASDDSADIPGWFAEEIAVGGGRLVVAGSGGHGCPVLAVGDVANPRAPTALGSLGLASAPTTRVPTPEANNGWSYERFAPPANVVALAVAADGRTAYGVDAGRSCDQIWGDSGGLTVFDLADPARPRVAGSVHLPSEGRAIVVRGKTAYVAANKAGALIVDVADPDAPRIVGPIDRDRAGGSAQALALDGTRLAVAFSGRVALYDVADPERPRFVAGGPVPGGAGDVALTSGWVWVRTGEAGLLGYDLSRADVVDVGADVGHGRPFATSTP